MLQAFKTLPRHPPSGEYSIEGQKSVAIVKGNFFHSVVQQIELPNIFGKTEAHLDSAFSSSSSETPSPNLQRSAGTLAANQAIILFQRSDMILSPVAPSLN